MTSKRSLCTSQSWYADTYNTKNTENPSSMVCMQLQANKHWFSVDSKTGSSLIWMIIFDQFLFLVPALSHAFMEKTGWIMFPDRPSDCMGRQGDKQQTSITWRSWGGGRKLHMRNLYMRFDRCMAENQINNQLLFVLTLTLANSTGILVVKCTFAFNVTLNAQYNQRLKPHIFPHCLMRSNSFSVCCSGLYKRLIFDLYLWNHQHLCKNAMKLVVRNLRWSRIISQWVCIYNIFYICKMLLGIGYWN